MAGRASWWVLKTTATKLKDGVKVLYNHMTVKNLPVKINDPVLRIDNPRMYGREIVEQLEFHPRDFAVKRNVLQVIDPQQLEIFNQFLNSHRHLGR
ncbi:hypothetical protein BLA29_011758 [Euroglyphus maynei]|uniref:Uncharacterized protein n=1 Tax=Euroglyphus maynei TaxID=6958 RepID=A0A1Y3BL28_EURMA|nr:hypothetical protein BLA29_011758 [Euroglyphus maynei]